MKVAGFLRLFGAALLLLTAFPSSALAGPARPPAQAAAHPVITADGPRYEIRADSFGLPLAEGDVAQAYARPSVFLQAGERIRFEAVIETEGDYTFAFDMAAAESFINAPEGQLRVDGVFPSDDARRIRFPIYYRNTADTFPLNRYGNEALIRQERLIRWTTVAVRDANLIQSYPTQFHLTAGAHALEFEVTQEALFLGSIYIEAFTPYPGYSAYLAANPAGPSEALLVAQASLAPPGTYREAIAPLPTGDAYLTGHPASDSTGVLIELEAERPAFKNDTAIRPMSDRSLDVTPYDTYRLLLNTLGGESWKNSGSTVYYEFTVPQDGLYEITLRALQNTKNNFTVFRRFTLDGAVPFEELNAVPFGYATRWANLPLGGATPYKIYLSEGRHVLGIEATAAPYQSAIEKIKKVLIDINTLSLEIKRLTGNQVDPFKEWVISDYIPDIQDQLLAIAADLREDEAGLLNINRTGGSQEILSYQMAIENLLYLAEDPDKIPVRMNRFSEGSGSAAQLLGNLLPALQSQPLALDKLYIHSPDTPPRAVEVSWATALGEGVKRFFHSFRPDPYQSIGADDDEIEVWVNRPRQYVDLLQELTDQTFTPDTGIKVKFSIMPDEGKLVLANAAGIQPDVALGVSTDKPYELAVRNALYDLRSFEDFDRFIRIYSPGALLSYIINDSVYAIPETQDFWVTYYRQDILDSLGLPVPHTWNEVIEILPELQRYGMNFNAPLSVAAAQRNYIFTAPYLFNQGAQLYSADGFATGLESEEAITAVKFMAESFTIYGMPLATSSFYDSFRYGSLPIGVSNFTDYIKLMTAAPELNGLWGIDLYPATVLPDGTQNRYATGSAQASILFANTDRPADGWEFMKWWMSTETQVDFQQQLILNYGPEYLWSSANLEAFQYSSFPPEHKAVILEQWQWLQEPVKLPGSYMQERELSNAWNKIVFDGVNPRVAIDSSIIIINREIRRKMEEFGYLQDGVKVKEFKIPTIETVKGWMDNGQ